jgi:hypothetical protein
MNQIILEQLQKALKNTDRKDYIKILVDTIKKLIKKEGDFK